MLGSAEVCETIMIPESKLKLTLVWYEWPRLIQDLLPATLKDSEACPWGLAQITRYHDM